LREVQARRRAREVQLLGDRHEVPELAEIHGGRIYRVTRIIVRELLLYSRAPIAQHPRP
jgi:hypothetical protein